MEDGHHVCDGKNRGGDSLTARLEVGSMHEEA